MIQTDIRPDSDQETRPLELLVVGGGEVAVAVAQLSRVLDWHCRIVDRLLSRDDLGSADAVIVLSHDIEIAGTALQQALATGVGYVGGMGSRTTQRRRHDWLVDHQVSPLAVEQIYGPAGLDIGADGPAEIGLSIIAEITAVRHGTHGGFISRLN